MCRRLVIVEVNCGKFHCAKCEWLSDTSSVSLVDGHIDYFAVCDLFHQTLDGGMKNAHRCEECLGSQAQEARAIQPAMETVKAVQKFLDTQPQNPMDPHL